MKSVKVTEAHHRALKMRGAQYGVSLQQYLAFLLEVTFSENPLVFEAREAFFAAIKEPAESAMEMVKRLSPGDEADG